MTALSVNFLRYSNTAYVSFDEQGVVIEHNEAFLAMFKLKENSENIFRVLPESLIKEIKKHLNSSNFQILKPLIVGESSKEVEFYIEFIRNTEEDVAIIHGTDDKTVPFEQGERLSKVREGIEFIAIPEYGHNNISNRLEYKEMMDQILLKIKND